MPFNPDGTYSRAHDWTDDKAGAVPVTASRHDAEDDGYAAALQFLHQNRQPLSAVLTAISGEDGNDIQIPGNITIGNTDLHLKDTDASHDLIVSPGSNLTADRTLTVTTGDADRTLTLTGNASLSGTHTGTHSGTSSGTNTGDQTITLTGDVTGSGTGSFAATIPNDTVTNAKAANMAQSTIKGRAAGAGTGDPSDLTPAQVMAVMGGYLLTGVQRLTSGSGTYTPTAGTRAIRVIAQGGGGGGGGAQTDGSAASAGGGGASGGLVEMFITPLAASYAYTVGGGGAGGAGTGGAGTSGSNTTFGGASLVAGGGVGGAGKNATSTFTLNRGGPQQTENSVVMANATVLRNLSGEVGSNANIEETNTSSIITKIRGGNGGGLGNGQGSEASSSGTSNVGENAGSNSGAGGGGAANFNTVSGVVGGNGGSGYIVIEEYI